MKQLLLAVTLLTLLVGCGGPDLSQQNWGASVQVQGNTAVVTVKLDGLRLGKDYHTHLTLDGGPEVMMYDNTYTFSNLKPGAHQVKVYISDPKHVPVPGMEKLLDFEIK